MAEDTGKDIDGVDVVSGIAAIIGTASALAATGTLFWGIVYGTAYGIQHWLRRTEMARRFSQRITTNYPQLENVAPLLLPGPKEGEETAITIRQDRPIDVCIVDAYEDEPFYKRATRPLPGYNAQVMSATTTTRQKKPLMDVQTAFLNKSLKRLRQYISYMELPTPPSKLAVPIGIESVEGNIVWGDFSNDGNLIHALVAGQTSSGKDALLRLWFTTLTIQNTPEEIQFVILDGKGVDWLSPALAESAYMAIKPAGGIDIRKINGKWQNIEQDSMANNLAWIFEEMHNRGELMHSVGAVDIAGYNRKSMNKLPYIFVLASDVGDTFNNDLELLMKLLIARGRSYGVRLLISMQNPVGENTKWRSQIGLVMSGYQQDPLHDNRIMGINVDRLLVRPSQLPNPEETDISKGLFVVRLGNTQHLVRTPHLPEDDWFRYIENVLPKKRDWQDVSYSNKNSDLLNKLLNAPEKQITAAQPIMHQTTKRALTDEQITRIQELVFRGKNKTEIMLALGFSNGDVYNAKKDAVGIIINATKRKMQ